MARCEVCFRHCEIREGELGFCGSRMAIGGKVRCANYGKITSCALDPIEKKPLNNFYPGSMILSIGSFGCNLRCPFCQNADISWSDYAMSMADVSKDIYNEVASSKEGEDYKNAYNQVLAAVSRNCYELSTPKEIAEIAEKHKAEGNIGVAFTYNEPMIGYEFVLDTAMLVKAKGMKTVLVTNGTAEVEVLEKILPYIDAMNIDIKGFSDEYYSKVLGGSFDMVKAFIARAVKDCHVELTNLIIPELNDSEEEMRELSSWIASLKDSSGNVIGKDIPLHISRFFPRFKMKDKNATEISQIYILADVAGDYLNHVYTGNC